MIGRRPARWPSRLLGLAACAVALSLVPVRADAQVWKRIGIGANIGFSEPIDSEVDGTVVVGGRGGLAPDAGWDFDVSLGWFTADVYETRTADRRRVGELRVRPLLGGIGYTWMTGPLATTASVTAGVSWNSATLDSALANAAAAGGGTASLDIGHSFALRPALEVEYFVARKVSLMGAVNLLFTRPTITLTTPEGTITDRWDANSVTVMTGVVVYPFR